MSINGPVSRGFVVKNRGAEPPEIGTGDDEEEDDGDEAGEVEDGGLGRMGGVCWVRERVCESGSVGQGAGKGKSPLLARKRPSWGWT